MRDTSPHPQPTSSAQADVATPPAGPARRHRPRPYPGVVLLCAVLIPAVAVGAARLTDDGGLARVLCICLIATLTGIAVRTSPAAV